MEILKKYFIILSTIALLFPSIVSLAHINAHHDEVACFNFADNHIHKKSFDCELCDFRITNLTTFSPVTFTPFVPDYPGATFLYSYQFLSDYQKLPFELRGPPATA